MSPHKPTTQPSGRTTGSEESFISEMGEARGMPRSRRALQRRPGKESNQLAKAQEGKP
jgi:hypothetical protein